MGNHVNGFEWKRLGNGSWKGIWQPDKISLAAMRHMPETIDIQGRKETRKFTRTEYNDGDSYLIYVDETNTIFAAYEVDK